MNILIADDSALIRNSLKKRLQQIENIGGIHLAGSVASALEIIEKFNPEILIIDFQFPEGTGFDIAKAGKLDSGAKIIIMFTNYANEILRTKSFEYGADYFFDKSGDFEKVFEVINDYANKMKAINN